MSLENLIYHQNKQSVFNFVMGLNLPLHSKLALIKEVYQGVEKEYLEAIQREAQEAEKEQDIRDRAPVEPSPTKVVKHPVPRAVEEPVER